MINKLKNICGELCYNNGALYLEKISFLSMMKKTKTPFYCYSINEFENNFKKFEKSTRSLKPLICYALKANFNSQIVSRLAKLGCGADVVSIGELKIALKNGIEPKKIVFSGVGKTAEEIKFALKKNILQINIESYEELVEVNEIAGNMGKNNINISIRVNPDVDANTHDKISTGRGEDKFGISIEKTKEIILSKAKFKNINVNGLAVHIGSQITNLKPFKNAFSKIRKLILFLNSMSIKIKNLDLGGGIGINYSFNNQINLDEYVKLIEKNFKIFNVNIIFEPGRSIIGSSGILISKVIRIKHGQKKKFVIIDAGMNDLIRPSLYNAYHLIVPVSLKTKRLSLYDFVGPICESSDVFGKDRKINELSPGDLVAICSTGAYGSSMASNYNCRKPANELFVKGSKIIKN